MTKKVSIIIVHWNTPDLLKKLLKLLTGHALQIIVIDNASRIPLDWIKKEFQEVELVKNHINRGYAFACNQGIVKAVGEWLLFLNPDVEIDPNTIQQMINQAEQQKIDACSPLVGDNYQKPLPSWFSLLLEFTPLNKLSNFINFQTLKTLFGGCLLIRHDILKSLGGWDERFFLWFEDSDLTMRLIKNKYKIGWVPLKIKHLGASSFNRLQEQNKRDIFFHSMDIFSKKHFSAFGRLIISLIKKKYTDRQLLPNIYQGTSITVPNLKKNQLLDFFETNKNLLSEIPELMIVTSALSTEKVWEWRIKFPQVRFILIDNNHGFAKTVNIGFRVSAGKWVGTVNDDVILTKDWLTSLIENTDKNTGSFNPVIKKMSGVVESAGIKILLIGKAIPLLSNHFQDGRLQNGKSDVRETDATNAAAVIYSKEALNKIGLFDERFGSYLEDIDLSLRLKRSGYKNIVCLNSEVIHSGQQTSKNLGPKKQYLDFKNWILLILKNWSLKDIILNLPSILIERLRNLSGLLKSLTSSL